MSSGKKYPKSLSKRFKEDDDISQPKEKKKHRDKIAWRLLRKEQKEKYEL
jgi:hypothetical protein